MWVTRDFERKMEASIRRHFPNDQADEHWAAYETARGRLVRDIYSEIKSADPDRSDHGESHIAEVLDNLGYLLEGEIEQLNGAEVYCLGMIALFHDVGNLFGREDHQRHIAEVFDWVRGTEAKVRHERTLVLRAARAHTGVASDGTPDTLREVAEQDHLFGKALRLQELAALLRFADELAEGPRRTSEFRRQFKMYDPGALIYHAYASITNVFIDRGTERVLLTYEIDVDEYLAGSKNEDGDDGFRELLDFTYWRASKVDQERRYARFYADLLAPFKSTWVQMNFHSQGRLLEMNLPPLRLDDKFVPGAASKEIPEIDAAYEIATIIQRIRETADFEAPG